MSDPQVPALFNQAVNHHRAGRLKDAEAAYREVLGKQPAHAMALSLLGLIAVQVGQPATALVLLDRSLKLRPKDADTLSYRGQALRALGRLPEAIATYIAVLRSKPGDFGLLYNLGNAQREAEMFDDAILSFRRAIKIQPNNPDAHNNLGNTLRQKGQYTEAAESFRRAIALAPGTGPLHFNLASALEMSGDLTAAAESFAAAATLLPDTREAQAGRGRVLMQLGRTAEAAAAYGAAVLGGADTAAAHTDLARALAKLGRRAEALQQLRRAVTLAPDAPEAYANLGSLLRDMGDDAGAVHSLQHALRLQPEHAGAQYNLGITHLLAGRLQLGWPLYGSRVAAMTGAPPRFAALPWRGERMAPEQTLLLHAEQGLGDTLMFCRFVSAAKAASGARVVLEVQPPLQRLLANLAGSDLVLAAGEALPAFDHHCPLPSLPGVFETDVDTIPATMPYLRADPHAATHWAERLEGTQDFKIGLAWAGNPDYGHDDLRSIPPELLGVLDGLSGVIFISLQKERGRDLAGRPPVPITIDWTDELNDMWQTAALLQNLDLIVTADTAVVHLAGAMAQPVWLLNRFDTDWRWMRDRTEDSPWYPTLRQFRQSQPGGWDAVLHRVRRELAVMVS